MKHILLVISCFSFVFLFSQENARLTQFTIAPIGSMTPSKVPSDWSTFVYNLEAPFPGTESYRNFLEQQKQRIPPPNRNIGSAKKSASDEPIVTKGFVANPFGGIPNDNDMAISNDGFIVSVCNSIVNIYHEDSITLLNQVSLNAFADSLGFLSNSYDPRVEYDPSADRFVMVFLNGSEAAFTQVGLCFSKTNNPMDGWHLYAIEGNPFNENTWSDFPAIAITENEFFLTLNHIDAAAVSWQTGFLQSVIWQLGKQDAYAGNPITTQLYSEVKFDGKYVRNLLPVKGGSAIVGPEMYFLSNRNFDLTNDTFFIVKIEDEMANMTAGDLTADFIISDTDYGVPPNATQPTGTFLQTNDSRPLGAYIEYDQIHFVGNTVNPTTNLAAIYHSIYNVETGNNACHTEILGGADMEYGYPNISYSGFNTSDDQAIIGFNHSSIDSFPGFSALFYSADDGYSNRVKLKSGTSEVSLISGNVERWGDYTGNQRKYNDPGVVWMSGLWGRYKEFAPSGTNRAHETYVAALRTPDETYVGLSSATNALDVVAYPNPLNNHLFVSFDNPMSQTLHFTIFDAAGKEVKVLLQDRIKKGKNVLHFSTDPLVAGSYLLVIKSSDGSIVHIEKLLK